MPATELPPGSYDDRGPAFQAFCIVVLIISILAIVLRFWSRAMSQPPLNKSRFWWDDWVALAATATVASLLSLTLLAIALGGGKHIWMIPPDDLQLLIRVLFSTYLVYDLGLALAKASALLFFSRVFPAYTTPRWFSVMIKVTHLLNVAWFIGIVLGTFFMCDPPAKNWNPVLPGTCGTMSNLYIGSAVPSVAIDLFILILPVPLVWTLQVSRVKKFSITAVFILGYCSIVVSIGRLITVLRAGESVNDDVTYEGIPAFFWIEAEIPVMLLSISLPAMMPLARHVGVRYFEPLITAVSSVFSSKATSFDDNKYNRFTRTPQHGDLSTTSYGHTRLSSAHDDREELTGAEGSELYNLQPSGKVDNRC
ncbi:hypothetical protein GGS23DRAFT_592944 [Durotheca rogersii]|uniref:uncharacterized protein n=1 Tax=Durotheca rogersii TaxID=419775 RepID=UPI00221F59A6|nr:uncharacterized protein GGS23DRAFT_592944 [Durotheca rogersii]KAI5867648.1 hypothetical protein GGS23DRAFT_592944 [Durotheca rogersii]